MSLDPERADAEPWDRLRQRIEAADRAGLVELLGQLSSTETARAISRLDSAAQRRLLELVDIESAADVVHEVPDVQAVGLLQDLAPERAAAIVGELRSDERVDLLGEIQEDAAEAIIGHLESEDADEVRELMQHAPDTAGGVMITEYLAYPRDETIAGVLDDFRANRDAYTDYEVQYVFVTAADDRLAGVLKLRDILFAPRAKRVSDLMLADPIRLDVTTPLSRMLRLFDEHPFLGLPVTDAAGRLVGVVRRADVEEAAARRAHSTFLQASGIVGGEELRSMPLRLRSRRRLGWLTINIGLNILAASVIAAYQDTLQQVIALAVFLPIISDMSGCSGNQSVAVSVRELALGLVKPSEVWRVLAKEAVLGAMNGLVLGLVLATLAFLWKGNVWLALCVGSALSINTLVSVCLGGLLPLVLRRMKLDPALVSGPLLTTVTDMCGFMLVLGIGTALLPRLV